MELNDEVLSALLQAVKISPESAPLRRHYAEVLLNRGYIKEAESEFYNALDLAPNDPATQLGLARALYGQNKHSNALLLVKQVIRQSNRPAKAYILYARLLLALGSVSLAADEYRKGLEEFPEVNDPDLASTLGIPQTDKGGETEETEAAVTPTTAGPATEESEKRPQESPPTELPPPPQQAPAKDTAQPPAETEPQPEPPAVVHLPGPKAIRQLFSTPPSLSFPQVGGMEQLKHELDLLLVRPMRDPAFSEAFVHGFDSRLLLYGPPGCGKTHIARALAGELLASFLVTSLQDLMEVWGEDSAGLLREIFRQARSGTPSVLVVRDVEGASRTLIQQLLKELDESRSGPAKALLLLTTDAPWSLPPVLLRAGRFDRQLFIPPPSTHDRAEILRLFCQGKPQRFLSHEAVAEATEGFAGRDLRTVVDHSLRHKLRQSLEQGQPSPLATSDLLQAAKEMKGTVDDWLAAAREGLEAQELPPSSFRSLALFLGQELDPDPA